MDAPPADAAAAFRFHAGDCADLLRGLPDDSIDLILTDPPWGATRLRLDENGRPPPAIWPECMRVAKPAAWLFCFGNLRLWADVMAGGFEPYFEYIWLKAKLPLNKNPRHHPTHAHESCMVFHCGADHAAERYYDADALRTHGHAKYARRARTGRQTTYRAEHGLRRTVDRRGSADGSRAATTILSYANKSAMQRRERTDHPTQKPTDMLRYLIRGYCPPDGVVLDPYAGSGSTLVAARAVGRRFAGAEINPEWQALCSARLLSIIASGGGDEA